MNDSFISNQNQNSSHGMTPLYHTNSQNSYSNPPAYEQVINGNRSISIGYSSMMGSPGGALPPLGPLPYGGTLTSYGAPISPPPAYGTLPATTSESSLTSLSSAGNNHSADSNLIPVRKRQVSDDFVSPNEIFLTCWIIRQHLSPCFIEFNHYGPRHPSPFPWAKGEVWVWVRRLLRRSRGLPGDG